MSLRSTREVAGARIIDPKSTIALVYRLIASAVAPPPSDLLRKCFDFVLRTAPPPPPGRRRNDREVCLTSSRQELVPWHDRVGPVQDQLLVCRSAKPVESPIALGKKRSMSMRSGPSSTVPIAYLRSRFVASGEDRSILADNDLFYFGRYAAVTPTTIAHVSRTRMR